MATKSFLSAHETHQVLEIIQAEAWDEKSPSQAGIEASSLCEKILLEKFEANPAWRAAGPIRLGSWSRGELCAKSDIDLLFIGAETKVAEFVSHAQKLGVKIRARVPENLSDWTQGVEAFDILALYKARAFYPEHEKAVAHCHAQLSQMNEKWKTPILKKLSAERRERESRFDSISNFLEPNLKYGHGGLRDLEQALMIKDLFPDKFVGFESVFQRLAFAKGHFLTIRHFAHLKGGSDLLTSSIQLEWSKLKNISSPIVYMGAVSRMLSAVSFAADGVEEIATIPNKKVFDQMMAQESANKNIELKKALNLLTKNPTIYNQRFIKNANVQMPAEKKQHSIITPFINTAMKEKTLEAFFRSRLIHDIFPDLKKIRGLVQHDQYHRYSCDTHIWQAMRLVLKSKKKPSELGSLATWAKKFKKTDWEILLLAALFHDLAKGRDGDHSTVGEKLAIRELTKKGYHLRTTIEVAWLVKNHLIMSSAAFRMNPSSPLTWAELYKRGVRGDRIFRLAIFTAIDIRATNPDALTNWKTDLLSQLVSSMISEKGHILDDFLIQADKNKITVAKDTLQLLDLGLIAALPAKILIKDLQQAFKTKKSLKPKVFKGLKKSTWIRFQERVDKPGLFLNYTLVLNSLGLSIQEAYVMTDNHMGVYDWFRVKSNRTSAQIKKLLDIYSQAIEKQKDDNKNSIRASNMSSIKTNHVQFASIEIVSDKNDELILSFRGKDQKGALMSAAKALFDAGFEIKGAKVHTWGQQIDDIFTVRKTSEWNQGLAVLRKTLLDLKAVNKHET
jgi:[protein-PII] uridylyltransferase